jgi:hypothetical protein
MSRAEADACHHHTRVTRYGRYVSITNIAESGTGNRAATKHSAEAPLVMPRTQHGNSEAPLVMPRTQHGNSEASLVMPRTQHGNSECVHLPINRLKYHT